MINLPKKDYGNLEYKILNLFRTGTIFRYNNDKYKVLLSDKPKTQRGGGEPKTDVFIRGKSLKSNRIIDFKISVKMDMTNIFVENKITHERFNEIFSKESQKTISETLYENVFPQILEKTKMIYESKRFPLGWKCEIALNDNRRNRVHIKVSSQEAEEIYTGNKRPLNFKNAVVSREVIENSGVPDFILSTTENEVNTPEEIFSRLVPIQEYVEKPENQEFDVILTGLGLFVKNEKDRFFKWDGNRPLLVGVRWVKNDNGIQGIVDINNLFGYRGNEMANYLFNVCLDAEIPMNSIEKFWIEFKRKVASKQLIFPDENFDKKTRHQKNLDKFF